MPSLAPSPPGRAGRPRPGRSLLILLVILLTAPLAAGAAESSAELARGRVRAGGWAGGGVVTGTLALDADTALVRTSLRTMSAVAAGLELWPEEALGVYLGAVIGTGADITLPDTRTIRLSVHQFEAGGRYRWHLGARGDAAALFIGFGLRAVRQSVQIQRPSLLVSSTLFGPELSAGGELPLFGGLWLRATARAGVPFFVRETPDDSGDPRSYQSYGGRAELIWHVWEDWAAQLQADLVDQEVSFKGEGTRAAGVDGAITHDRFTTLLVLLRRSL